MDVPLLSFDWECFNKVYYICMYIWIYPLSDYTVDGRNPAPPGMYTNCKWWNKFLSTGAGFQPSTVWPPFAQKAKNLLLVKECWINKSTHLSNGFNQKRTGCSPFQKKEVIIVPTQKYVLKRWSLFFQVFPWKCSTPSPLNLKHKSTTAIILPENNWDLPARRARLKEQSCWVTPEIERYLLPLKWHHVDVSENSGFSPQIIHLFIGFSMK